VTAAEVLDLDLGGALVTLSACESGRPGWGAAEPVGLAWAFLAAGASGAIVSQWVVNDRATAALMARLYERLTAGESPQRALRGAQLETAAGDAHPYFWAPFTYVGFPATAQDGWRP
jgi:CHAT domain-containing protein